MENETLELKLSEYAYIGRTEKLFHEFYQENDFNKPILVDFMDVSYIQITTLVYLAQFIYKREKNGYKTSLRLPLSDEVKIFMFTWRFFEIVEELTGKNIFHFIEGARNRFPIIKHNVGDKEFYLDMNKDYFDKYYKEEQLKYLVKKGFFSLVCEPFKDEKQKYLVLKNQRRTWSTEKLITDVLQKNLLDNKEIGSMLSNTIIFECLTNAANHPESDHLVIGSFCDYTRKEEKPKEGNNDSKGTSVFFTIVIWDDGHSIIKTLSDAISLDKNIRATDSFEVAKKSGLKPWFRIIRSNYKSTINRESLFYDYLPTKASEEDELLLSSFMPGISRKPIEKQESINNEESLNTTSGTGLGLTHLLKAVIKDLGGSIHLRTNNYLLEIENARKGGGIQYNDMLFYKKINEEDKKAVDFYCKSALKRYNTKGNSFIGNMITIKIPLNL
jgi:hypothetical protein